MILVQAEALSRHYSAEPVFTGLTFQILPGDRIGLVGPNGAGKTTLLKLLARTESPDGGRLHFHPDVETALLRQFPDFPPGATLYEQARLAMSELIGWREEMVRAGQAMAEAGDDGERARAAQRYDHFHELLRRHGGYEFDHRIEEVLFGLGFSKADFDRDLASFSGGQQSRVLLAQLLLRSPDLMFLDEPTNHLDVDTTEWLENFLVRQSAAMVVVSHDRYFLDKTTNRIFELAAGRLEAYTGNYQAYLRQRQERQKTLDRIAQKQREEIAHHEEFVRRNKSGQLARQAKSREKRLARLEEELVETIGDVCGPSMGFAAATRTGDIVLTATRLSKGYDRPLFSNLDLQIDRGRRLGIVGPNGAGKTTLLRVLLGLEPPDAGEVRLGANVRIGYLDQQLERLEEDQTALEAVRPPWKAAEKAETFRGLLARFGIGADLVDQKVASLSGGERTRVALARVAASDVNVLVLDEPTNHLDLWARESLERALGAFDGTVLVVSHDRYFLNAVVDGLYWIADGMVRYVAGDYDRLVEERERWRREAASPAKDAKESEKGSSKRKRKFPFRKTQEIEADIQTLEKKIAELESSLAQPEVYRDGRKVREISVELELRRMELERLMEHWEESMELNPK